MVACGLQTFLPGGIELTARLTAPNNMRTQHVKIERKGRDNRTRQERQTKSSSSSSSSKWR